MRPLQPQETRWPGRSPSDVEEPHERPVEASTTSEAGFPLVSEKPSSSGEGEATTVLPDIGRAAPIVAVQLARRTADTATKSLSESTLRSYETGWRQWQQFARDAGWHELPAHPTQVAMWAQHLSDAGARAATVAIRIAAVGWAHRHTLDESGRPYPSPTKDPRVTAVLAGLRRQQTANGSARRQANALSVEDLAAVEAAAMVPRVFRGRPETPQQAYSRGSADIALVRMMRDGLLRISEAAAARWDDVVFDSDGSATLRIRRSKSDQEGEGAEVWLSPATAAALKQLRDVQGSAAEEEGARIVGTVSARTVARRLAAAYAAAGLGSGYSGHSGRVGMAQDLAASGAGLPAIMTAGRWKSSAMPAHYTARQAAAHGAVAAWYNQPEPDG